MALRVETAAPVTPVTAPIAVPSVRGLEEWRTQALQAGERLKYAETQLKDLRVAADEARDRLTKAKQRLDTATARTNELQAQVVRLMADRDALQARVVSQDALKRAIWDLMTDTHTALERVLERV